MRICSECNTEMVHGLNLIGGFHGEKMQLSDRLPKGNMNKITVKAAVCPKCGYIFFYTDDIENVKKIAK